MVDNIVFLVNKVGYFRKGKALVGKLRKYFIKAIGGMLCVVMEKKNIA